MPAPEYHITHKGYIMLPCFDVYIDDPQRFCGSPCDASHWGQVKTFIFDNFFAPFWDGTVHVRV